MKDEEDEGRKTKDEGPLRVKMTNEK